MSLMKSMNVLDSTVFILLYDYPVQYSSIVYLVEMSINKKRIPAAANTIKNNRVKKLKKLIVQQFFNLAVTRPRMPITEATAPIAMMQ